MGGGDAESEALFPRTPAVSFSSPLRPPFVVLGLAVAFDGWPRPPPLREAVCTVHSSSSSGAKGHSDAYVVQEVVGRLVGVTEKSRLDL